MTRWKKRIAWACMLLLVCAGAAWAGQTAYRAVRSFVVETTEPHDVVVTGREGPVTFGVGGGSTIRTSDPDLTQEQAEELHELIKQGRYEVEKTVAGDDGRRIRICKVTLSDGTVHQTGVAEPPAYELDEQTRLQEIQNQIDAKLGELTSIGRLDYGGSTHKFYGYSYTLSNGQVSFLGRGAPYLGAEEAVFEEVDALIAAGQGELAYGPDDGAHQYCYRFTLSDGRVMKYICNSPLR